MFLDFFSALASAWYVVPILMGLGVIFCIVEACVPGFGIFGLLGIVMFTLGVVYYALIERDEPWKVVCVVAGAALFVMLLFGIVIISSKKGALGKTGLAENKTALPVDFDLSNMMDKTKYYGKFGVVVAPCKPLGKVKINDDIVECVSRNGMIEEGKIVKVVAIDDNKMFVEVDQDK